MCLGGEERGGREGGRGDGGKGDRGRGDGGREGGTSRIHTIGLHHRINLLQYADDTCVIADSPAACQQQLNQVDQWLGWSGMKAKVTKCYCVAI